jgi:hypothetical protein
MTVLKKFRIFILIAVCVAVALCAYLIYARQHYADHVPPGTYLAGQDVGGFTRDEARQAGQKIYDGIVMNLTLQNDSGVASAPAIAKTLSADDVGISFDADATARTTMDAASDEWFVVRVNPLIRKDIGLSLLAYNDVITEKIEEYFNDAVFASKLPKLKYSKDDKTFVMTPGVVGTALDTARFIEEMQAGALRAGESEYSVHLIPVEPRISDSAAAEAKAIAERAIKAKISFEKDGKVAYKAGTNSKASWITFTANESGGKYDVGVDDDKVMKFLRNTASAKLVEKPLPELIVREIDMESAEKEAKKKAKKEEDDKKAKEASEEQEDAREADVKSKASEPNDEEEPSSDKEEDADASDDEEETLDAADVEIVEPAPKEARVVRKGEEGLAIADRAELAGQIEESMLAGEDIKLTPKYEAIPYETEEIGPDFGKWIETNLTQQKTWLWDGNKKLKTYTVSTGKNVTPTITGAYAIYMKRDHHDMKGYDPVKKKKYVQPDVRYISYFEGAYAYHAAYWHNAFGTQVSHGCINMKTAEAKYLYEWAPVGTVCIIHY